MQPRALAAALAAAGLVTSLPAQAYFDRLEPEPATTFEMGGALDMSFMAQNVDGQKHTFRLMSNQDESSRIFFRGRETLANGRYVRVFLQQGFKADTGELEAANRLFGQAVVAVGGAFGEVAAGRLGALKSPNGDYSQFYEFGGISPMHTNFPYEGVGYTFLTDGYVNNAIVYQSPEFSGFRFTAQYSNGVTDESGRFGDDNELLSLALRYKAGPWRGGTLLTWQSHNQNARAQGVPVDDTYDLFTALNYRLESASLKLTYQYVYNGFSPGPFLNWTHFGLKPVDGRGFDTHALMLGTELYLTGQDSVGLVVQGNYTKYKGRGADTVGGRLSGVRINPAVIWRHRLSRHLTLYGAASYSHGFGVYKRIDNASSRRCELDAVNVTTFGTGFSYFF